MIGTDCCCETEGRFKPAVKAGDDNGKRKLPFCNWKSGSLPMKPCSQWVTSDLT